MRAVIQRVDLGEVRVDGEVVGRLALLLVLLVLLVTRRGLGLPLRSRA